MKQEFIDKARETERQLRNGEIPLKVLWQGYDLEGVVGYNVIEKERSIQRSLMLTYCSIFGVCHSFYNKTRIEIGIEKNAFTCRSIGFKYKQWQTIDKIQEVKGWKADIVNDFMNDSIVLPVYDLVICASVMEHIFNIHKGFRKVFDLCAKGGYVYFSTPFLYKLHLKPEDYWRLTPYAYEKIIPQYSYDYIILEENYCGKLWGVSCFARKK